MIVNITEATNYLKYHNESHKWDELEDDEKESYLITAKTYIDSIELRKDVFDLPVYDYAIYEQAIHLVIFSKERFKLQQEGVTSYKFDDMNFIMDQSIISPIAKQLLKRYMFKRMGEIV